MSRTVLTTLQVLVAVVTIAIWWIISETSLIGDPARIQFFFSTPADVFWQIVAWFRSGEIWHHLWITLIEAALAFIIGAVAAMIAGFWLARRPRVAAVFDPYVKAANALPRVVLAPIFTLWFGLGIWSKVALGFTLVLTCP